MSDKDTELKITPRQRVLWALLTEVLRRDLEACGLTDRALPRARIQVALHDDNRYLVDILSRLADHRRAHLN
jgi:hypothetical protein